MIRLHHCNLISVINQSLITIYDSHKLCWHKVTEIQSILYVIVTFKLEPFLYTDGLRMFLMSIPLSLFRASFGGFGYRFGYIRQRLLNRWTSQLDLGCTTG